MVELKKPLGITEVVLRDAHQSILATRMRVEDMLPICEQLDQIGYWAIESWGGATFDACIRYLDEDPWERLRLLKAAMPNTPQQMLLRGQNILGYQHYADDVVDKFVERCVINGIDVFRIFDAMNDIRNIQQAVKTVINTDAHAQGTMSYTTSPVHTLDKWVEQGKRIEDMGAHSICIKDMSGLLRPYVAFALVSQLKQATSIPIHLHCHATTGLSVATIIKAAEAGIDNVDTAISSLSMTYGHSPTEAIVASFAEQKRDTGLDLNKLENIATYFREIRKKYAQYEGSLKGVDSQILVSQVPGGMLTNLENQLKEQNASDKFDAVLKEIPKVRKDLGYIPLVTPTSQIVGTQAVFNVLSGKRYQTITKEIAGLLKGEYGTIPHNVNKDLQARVLKNSKAIKCRPADLIQPEMHQLVEKIKEKSKTDGIALAKNIEEDALINGLFPQIGWKFISNRGNHKNIEPDSDLTDISDKAKANDTQHVETYAVNVDGKTYNVEVAAGRADNTTSTQQVSQTHKIKVKTDNIIDAGVIESPMTGNILKINVAEGDRVVEGDVVLIMETMKMETEICSKISGTVSAINVQAGDSVAIGKTLIIL